MIKIYGMPTCPYCSFVDEQVKGNNRFKVIDIGSDVHYMHEFMDLRRLSAGVRSLQGDWRHRNTMLRS